MNFAFDAKTLFKLQNYSLHVAGLPLTFEESNSPPPSTSQQADLIQAASTSNGISQPSFTCPVCSESIPSFQMLQLHLRNHILMSSAVAPNFAALATPIVATPAKNEPKEGEEKNSDECKKINA